MKKQFILMSTIATVLLFSCKKENISNPAANGMNGSRIKTWVTASSVSNYTYDASGNLTALTYSDGSKKTYDYQPGKITEKIFDAGGINTQAYVYELNADGLVSKETSPQIPGFDIVTIYNSERQIVKTVAHANGLIQSADYFYSNGNCDSVRFSTGNTWNSSVIRSYYPDKLNSLDYDSQGTSFYGKGNKNLEKTEQYFFSDGSKGDLVTYSYELDAKGRAVKQTTSSGANLEIGLISYF